MKANTVSSKNKILFISYYFPPNTAVGGLRIANFAKNLHLLGWKTYALTIKDKYLSQIDGERLKGIESTKIYKTFLFPSIVNIFSRLKSCIYFFLKKNGNASHEPNSSFAQSNPNLCDNEMILQKCKRYFISLFIFLPDTEKNWILPAFLRTIWLIKRKKIDCILTSSPPHSVHLTGLLSNIFTRVRWVVDFRDPWFIGRSKTPRITCALSNKIERWLEKKVVRRADMVLTTNEKLCNALVESFKKQPQKKFQCVPNGFDAEIFSKIEPQKKYEQFTLSYTGTLYYGRTPEPVFRAIKMLLMEGNHNLEDVRIKLVGNCQYIDGYPIAPIIHSYGLDSVVEVIDSVPYLRSLEIIKQSHLALLFAPDQPFQIPAKVFDYIGSGTKILAIAGKGATSDLINSTGAGESFHPSDIEGIKEFIYRSISDTESKRPESKADMLHQFDRRVIIKNFANHLKTVI